MKTENELDPRLEASMREMSLVWIVRALMESHPNPESFRESLAHMYGLWQRDLARDFANQPDLYPQIQHSFAQLRDVWETYAPYSDAAKSKPKPGEHPE